MKWFSGITNGMLPGFLENQACMDLLDRVVEGTHGRFDTVDFIDLIRDESIQLWAAGEDEEVRGIVMSEITIYPRMKILRLFGLCGSGLSDLIENLPVIKSWAVAMGCQEIGLEETRAGLELAVPGFQRSGVCLRMDLTSLGNMETIGAA